VLNPIRQEHRTDWFERWWKNWAKFFRTKKFINKLTTPESEWAKLVVISDFFRRKAYIVRTGKYSTFGAFQDEMVG
jgi:hypothetical protein